MKLLVMERIKQFAISPLLLLISGCFSLHISNMTAPVIQDPREDMMLSCSFYIGHEELYAVKWYKDDYEFFRYSPSGRKKLLEFDVEGVHVDLYSTKCNMSSCSLVLKNLTRVFSTGSYRCEVSIEAPTFGLASKTLNVTVAVIPQDKPSLDNLNDTYLVGDFLVGKCSTDLGDPAPIITWYINQEEVNPRFYRSSTLHQNIDYKLARVLSLLRYPLHKNILGNNSYTYVEVTCQQSSIHGSPQNTTRVIRVVSELELVNNHKFFDIFGSKSSVYRASLTTIITALVFVYK
ncbi:uncharacterized protein LOC123678776 [Harmonia axyridis]|uniref:uncharacterized protein LOC123678776 n=1 Tax=Harmonia axyridis TaxID=115357 RepID=UPI001E27733C|nr:uncharacterized protein LOC123678776 [Harmonia axyridis]